MGGTVFEIPQGVAIQTIQGEERQPLDQETLPLSLIEFLSVRLSILSRKLGNAGEAFQFFVFEGKGITSCQEGRFWVAYAGERYSYKTPIPGCELSV
jgi:hypothetical protein